MDNNYISKTQYVMASDKFKVSINEFAMLSCVLVQSSNFPPIVTTPFKIFYLLYPQKAAHN